MNIAVNKAKNNIISYIHVWNYNVKIVQSLLYLARCAGNIFILFLTSTLPAAESMRSSRHSVAPTRSENRRKKRRIEEEKTKKEKEEEGSDREIYRKNKGVKYKIGEKDRMRNKREKNNRGR